MHAMCQKKKRSVSALTGIATFFHGGCPGKTLMREVLERPDGRLSRTPFQGEMLVISELSVTAHALRSPSCPPGGTDLVALRDEVAHAMTATCFFFFGHLLASLQPDWDDRAQFVSPLHSLLRKAFRSIIIILLF